jgi:hypothetical protein
METSDVLAGAPGSGRYVCEASGPIYLEIGVFSQSAGEATAMVVRAVDGATAAARIAGMNRVLVPPVDRILPESPKDEAAHP